MIKGPLLVLFVGLTIVALAVFDRSVRWLAGLRPISGVLWLCVLVLPWFLAIVSRSGGNFFAQSVGQDLVSKVVSAQEAHGAPPGYYFALFWVTFWPGATLAAMAAPGIWASRREKGAKFLLCWIVPAWIVLELVITKLPHYVLPLYPAVAILIAGVVDLRSAGAPEMAHPRRRLVLLLAGDPRHRHHRSAGDIRAPARVAGLAVRGGGDDFRFVGLVALSSRRRRAFAAARDGGLHPARRRDLRRDRALGRHGFPERGAGIYRARRRLQAAPGRDGGLPGAELVFLVGTKTGLVDGTDAAEFLRTGGCRFALVEARHERAFLRRADAIGLRYAPPQRFEGYNYSVGRAVWIAVYRAEGAP